MEGQNVEMKVTKKGEREREREEQRAWRGRGEIGRSEDVRHDG